MGDRVLGGFDVESDRLAAFGPDDERLLASVASQAAMVLQNARLLVETRARATRFEAVNEIARAVSSFRAHQASRRVQYVVADVTGCSPAAFGDDVEVVTLERGTGWGAARNAGLKRSSGRVVVVIDEVVASGDFERGADAASERGMEVIDPRVDDRHRDAGAARAEVHPYAIRAHGSDSRLDGAVNATVGHDTPHVRKASQCCDRRARRGDGRTRKNERVVVIDRRRERFRFSRRGIDRVQVAGGAADEVGVPRWPGVGRKEALQGGGWRARRSPGGGHWGRGGTAWGAL